MNSLRRRDLLAGAAGSLGAACVGDDGAAPLWFSYGGKNREELLKLVASYNEREPAHRIKPVFQGDYFELLAKLRTALAAGRAPAVTHVVAEVIPYLVRADVLLPLDELGLGETSDFVGALAQSGTFGAGRPRETYGIPFNRSTPIAYFNEARLGELGFPPPSTHEELRALARAGTATDGSSVGFACPVDWWFWVAMVYQHGGELVDDTGRFTLGGEAGVAALARWQELVHVDRSMRPPSGRDYTAWQNINQEFLAGRYPMVWNSSAFLRYLESNAKFRVIAAPLPRAARAGVPSGGTMFVVPREAPPGTREAVRRFLAFMSAPEASNQFATRTGYIPVTRSGISRLRAEGYYDAVPNDAVPIDQLEVVRPWPWHERLFRVQREVVQARLESAVLRNEDPRTAIAGAVRALEEEP
jgi:sn-glycerol 3-phosphate transport system substrate-binding protein